MSFIQKAFRHFSSISEACLHSARFERPKDFFKANQRKLIQNFKGNGLHGRAIVLLEGTSEEPDQESNFFYCFGTTQRKSLGLLEVPSGKSVLFIEKHDENKAFWETIRQPEFFK